MDLGKRSGCHQKPERSFFTKGYQWPVCARCTGVLLGYIVGFPIILCLPVPFWLGIIGLFIMGLDWLLQYLNIKESTNKRRLFSGFWGGFAILYCLISLIRFVIKLF